VLLDRVTGERRPLTTGAEPVTRVVCTDGRQVVFEGAQEQARSHELFVADLEGRVRPLGGAVAHEWRGAKADHGCRRLLVTRSAWGRPPELAVRGVGDDEPVVALAGDPPDPLLARTATQPEVLPIVAADGHTPLNAFWFAPKPGGARRHPVIVLAYGGPTVSTVAWAWSRNTVLIAHWQQLGYGVFMVDNRGMSAGARDRAFTRAHFHAFGQVEVDDLFAAVRQLAASKAEVDPARIGLFGWSYGGYLAARSMLDAQTPFAAAVAVAPVTDWTLYDTAYTERYLGLPVLADGSASPYYRAGNLVPRAAQLRRPLLVMHGTADDNVLFEHTLRLVEALEDEGRLFSVEIYPGKAHGISGRKSQLHVYKTMDAFFAANLRPGAR
jgi:dipeptidyl-peptidase-4